MATPADFAMLNSALENAGHDALMRRRLTDEHDSDLRREAMEAQLRDTQESRYKAQEAHFNKMEEGQAAANQPKIRATLTHPSGVTVDFEGTPDQLQAMQDKEPGLKVSDKKQYSAIFKVGGGTFAFQDEAAASKFAADMKAKNGIDVYADQPSKAGDFDTISEKTPAIEAKPADVTNHWFSPPTTNSPAIPYQPERTITRRVPHQYSGGETTPQPPAAMAAAPAPAPTQPHRADVDWLNANPNPARLATFEKKYGQGSSTNYLKSANNLAVQ